MALPCRLPLRLHRYLQKYAVPNQLYSTMSTSTERAAEITQSLADIRSRVHSASSSASSPTQPSPNPTLVAVSKYKPASDILTCFEQGQLDFGENYVQELVEKAETLPLEIRWHFIGALQSNKAKTLASIPNLDTIQTLTTAKAARALDKALPQDRETPLKILIQVNTSGEDSKSGLAPLANSPHTNVAESEIGRIVKEIIFECPRLRVQGLMTIGALEQSLNASEGEKNVDFERLKETRDVLQEYLVSEFGDSGKWGRENGLVLSMGMSSDFEAALRAGSDIVRVGTGIFGERRKKLD